MNPSVKSLLFGLFVAVFFLVYNTIHYSDKPMNVPTRGDDSKFKQENVKLNEDKKMLTDSVKALMLRQQNLKFDLQVNKIAYQKKKDDFKKLTPSDIDLWDDSTLRANGYR